MKNPEKQAKKKIQMGILLGIAAVIVLGTGIFWMGSGEDSTDTFACYIVQRGPLTISVLENGTIRAKDQVIIKNEVEGRTSIISLIDEGTQVRKGELLVELDASSLLDNRIDQEISVQNAEAAYINATENLAVVENQAESDKDVASLTLDFARDDLKKYKEGEYPNDLKAAEAAIELAEEELVQADETLKWSQKLREEKYISDNELKEHELAVSRKRLQRDLAFIERDLLRDYTYPRQIKQFESDIRQAEMALERTLRKANADVVQAQADLKAKEAEFNRQKDKLAKIEDQITKTTIKAPADGLVIYATSAKLSWRGNNEPLDEGQEVHERQELIYLPIGFSSIAEVDVHEASLKKVQLGLPVVVTVDALPGQRFYGTVESIAPLPDAQSMWMNPDLKVYSTKIDIKGDHPTLRTGMSCKVEIIVEQYEDALYVPVQSVIRVGGQPTVYLKKGSDMIAQTVQIGLDNNRMIRILDGLKEGQTVLLAPPLEAAAVDLNGKSEESSPALEGMDQRIQQQLKQSRDRSSNPKRNGSAPGPAQKEKDRKGAGRPDVSKMTPQQRQAMKKRLENMSPEEREKIRKQMQQQSGEKQ